MPHNASRPKKGSGRARIQELAIQYLQNIQGNKATLKDIRDEISNKTGFNASFVKITLNEISKQDLSPLKKEGSRSIPIYRLKTKAELAEEKLKQTNLPPKPVVMKHIKTKSELAKEKLKQTNLPPKPVVMKHTHQNSLVTSTPVLKSTPLNLAEVDHSTLPPKDCAAWHFFKETNKDPALFKLFSGENRIEKTKHQILVATKYGNDLAGGCTNSFGFFDTKRFTDLLNTPIDEKFVNTFMNKVSKT